MKTLNELIADYTECLKQGELQIAYKGILDYLSRLRSDIASKHPDYEIGGSIYQGYMDMSYFSLNTRQLKEKGLKVAIVYLHEKGAFEIWLSARNREILKKFKIVFEGNALKGLDVFHQTDNEDAAIEYTLTSYPDFNNQSLLTQVIEQGAERFLAYINKLI